MVKIVVFNLKIQMTGVMSVVMIDIKFCPSCGKPITLIYGDTEVIFYQCWHCRVGVVQQHSRAIVISFGCSKHQFIRNGVLQDAATIHETMAGIAKLYCYQCKQYVTVDRMEAKQ